MEPLRKIFHARCQTNNRKFDLYQVESEYLKVKGLREKNSPKLILLYLKNNIQNQTISKLETDDEKTKCSSNSNDIHKSIENFYEKLFQKRQPPKLHLLNFLEKCLTERKTQMNNFTFVRLIKKILQTIGSFHF